MHEKTKRGIAAFGLALATSPGLFPVAEISRPSTLVASHEQQGPRVAQLRRVVARHTRLVLLANVGTEPIAKPLPMPVTSPSPWKGSIVTPEMREQLAHNARYVSALLLPAIKKHKLQVVQPINENPESPDYIKGSFMVTTNEKCGSQFFVNAQTRNISATVFGNLDMLRNGEVYGKDAYNGMLSHAEGILGLGYNFHGPEDAATYVLRTYSRVCHQTDKL